MTHRHAVPVVSTVFGASEQLTLPFRAISHSRFPGSCAFTHVSNGSCRTESNKKKDVLFSFLYLVIWMS